MTNLPHNNHPFCQKLFIREPELWNKTELSSKNFQGIIIGHPICSKYDKIIFSLADCVGCCEEIEELLHYKRTCEFCGHVWGGLHCPHDGWQNPCPNCNKRPTVKKDECNCEFDY